jgi:hypothetical protein
MIHKKESAMGCALITELPNTSRSNITGPAAPGVASPEVR